MELQVTTRELLATCEEHGDYVATETAYPHPLKSTEVGIRRVTRCPHCLEEVAQRRRQQAAKLAKMDLMARIQLSGIPPRFQSCSFETYRATLPGQIRALNVARAYAEHFEEAWESGRNLVFSGQPGCGKTHLATAIGLHLLIDPRTKVRYCTVGDMIRRVTKTWNRDQAGESEEEVLNDLTSAHLLILDEAGVQTGSRAEMKIITEVIDGRYRQLQPTVVVTNLPMDLLTPYLGDRVIDRLRDSGSELVAFDWTSHRRKQAHKAA